MPPPVKKCASCGKPFQTSRSGSTVNCPDCRAARGGKGKSEDKPKSKAVNCSCGKTNFIDGFGKVNSRSCPQCGDLLRTEKMRDGTTVNIHVKAKGK